MRLADLEVLVVGNPPPGFGGRYFVFVKLTTDDGVVGWGEVYAATVGPEAMRAVITDVFARHMAGENPENVELMFRRAYSAGFSQRPDPTVIWAASERVSSGAGIVRSGVETEESSAAAIGTPPACSGCDATTGP